MPRLNSLLVRLLLGSVIPLLLFLAAAAAGAVVVHRLLDALKWERHSQQVMGQSAALRRKLDALRLTGLARQSSPPPRRPAELADDFRRNHNDFQALCRDLRGEVADHDSQQERIAQVAGLEAEWVALVEPRVRAEATPQPADALLFFGRSDPHLAAVEGALDDFVRVEQGLFEERHQAATRETQRAFWVLTGAFGLAAILSPLLALASARQIAAPIRRLYRAAADLVIGRFHPVKPEGPDEIERLIVYFNHMAAILTGRAGMLEEEQARYRSYVGAVAHVLWVTDAAGAVTGDLPALSELTGLTAAQLAGRGWLDAVHPEDREHVESGWRRAAEAIGLFEAECRLRTPAGDYRHYLLRCVPVTGGGGRVRERICTCTDVTERVRQAELLRAKEAAEATSRAKSEFLTRMSHELRTPLNAVIGMSKMLLTQRLGALTPKQADYLKDITEAGQHLLSLINEVLDLARLEAGRMEVRPETVPLDPTVQAVLSTLRPLAEGKGVTLSFAPPADGELHTDPGRFRQVLYNLLSNAIKFTPGGGRVTVSAEWVTEAAREAAAVPEAEAGAVRVAVADTGVGIPPEEQEVIWEEFRQASGTPRTQGTGLGLPLTRRLVRLLGGDVWLHSAPGSGSTFTFVLPRQPPEVRPVEPAADAARPLALVVEDHPPTLRLLTDWLAEAGLATVSAYDGETGLDLARRLHPAVVVLDLNLPKLDGWQVLEALRNDPATAAVPVVVVTVDEEKPPASAFGVRDYFVKPVEREAFLARVHDLGLVRKNGTGERAAPGSRPGANQESPLRGAEEGL